MSSGIPDPALVDRFGYICGPDSNSYLPVHKIDLSNVLPILLDFVSITMGEGDAPEELLHIHFRASAEKQAKPAYEYFFDNYRFELLKEYAFQELRSLITLYLKPQIKLSFEECLSYNWIRTTLIGF